MTRKQITNVWAVALVAVAIVGLTAGAVNAQVTESLGTPIAAFEFKNVDQVGDVTHTDGLQITGWVGQAWANLNGNVSSEESATSGTPTVTFRWNVGGAAQTWAWNGGTTPNVRSRYSYVNNPARYLGAVPWRIEGLTEGKAYDIIFYGTARTPPDNSTARFAIPGYNSGNPVTLDSEGDGDFLSWVADGSGHISGTFDSIGGGEARVTGIQVAELTASSNTTAPGYTALSPTNGATGVAADTDLAITFDETVQKGIGNIVIKEKIGGGVVETIDVTAANVTLSGAVVTINPSSDLGYGTNYYVEIGSGAIKDYAATPVAFGGIADDTTWSFTTVPPDTTPPDYTTLVPTNNATDVVPTADLVITFDEPVQEGIGSIVIKESGGSIFETIDVTSGYVTVSGTNVTINPTNALAPFTDYYVEITPGAIKDQGLPTPVDFGGIDDAVTWRFTTGKTPTVVSIDFDSAGGVQSGEPIHADGPSIPGQVGPWHKLTMNGSGQSSTIDTGSGIFTFNTTLAAFAGYGNQEGGLSTPLRGNMFWMNSAASCTWTLTDLVPGAVYDIICYSTKNGTYKHASFSVDGFDGGNPQAQDDGSGDEEEGDVDFFGVTADETGKIQGTFAWISSWAEFGGIQFDKVGDPIPLGTVITLR